MPSQPAGTALAAQPGIVTAIRNNPSGAQKQKKTGEETKVADDTEPNKLSKKERKALGAAKQEAQRAAKAAAKAAEGNQEGTKDRSKGNGGKPPTDTGHSKDAVLSTGRGANHGKASTKSAMDVATAIQILEAAAADTSNSSGGLTEKDVKRLQTLSVAGASDEKTVPMFSHLPAYNKITSLSMSSTPWSRASIHPGIVTLGLKYADGIISGGNARCVAMLHTFKQVIQDFTAPADKEFRPALMSHLNNQIEYLIHCREKSIGMSTAIKYVKTKINMVKASSSKEAAKEELLSAIDEFQESRIRMADMIIAESGSKFIGDGDVIMTYASSHVLEVMFKKAHDDGKRFRVIIVDSRPKFEGRALLARLVKYGIECGYVMLTALSYVLKSVTKVFLGAAGLLSNGSVMSRLGTAVVAMMAESQDLPVIVCCETYKFCERVQLDSICSNELGNPDELVATKAREAGGAGDTLADWNDISTLRLLNLVYDITPIALVKMVITEVGNLPPTAVPVVIREYHKDIALTLTLNNPDH